MSVLNKLENKNEDHVKKLVTYKQCARCGKKVAVLYPTDYAYKYIAKGKAYYFCSWSCMQAARRKDPGKISSTGGSISYPAPKGTFKKRIECDD